MSNVRVFPPLSKSLNFDSLHINDEWSVIVGRVFADMVHVNCPERLYAEGRFLDTCMELCDCGVEIPEKVKFIARLVSL